MKKAAAFIELLLILIFLGCGAYVGFYFYQSHAGKAEFEEIREQVPDVVDTEDVTEDGTFAAYDELYAQNNDFVGWLIVPGTPIDYPVVQGDDNDFYMHKDFYKEYQYCGIPFADCGCAFNPNSDNIIIYAHNMKDGTMFAALDKYEDKSFFEANPTISFNTMYEVGTYKVIAAFHAVPTDFEYHSYINFETEERFNEFMSEVRRRSIYETNDSAQFGDKLLTLSTCSYNITNERFVVLAKKVS